MGAFVGIDLGTTYSVVAYINSAGKPEAIKNEAGRAVTPSVVFVGPQGLLVGEDAKLEQEQGATDIAAFFKRSMGDPNFVLSLGGRDYTPTDLSAIVLAYLKGYAERFLGAPVTDAVITVPAYFTHPQRQATIEAGRKAGLNVLLIISEPTAAALDYGLRPGQTTQRVLVYDLGGGTFDISLVEITPTDLKVIAVDGDHNLGGKDWDDRLVLYLAQQFQREFGVELVGDNFNELLVGVEKLKRSLSQAQSAQITVAAAGHSARYTVTRDQFEEITRDLLTRTQQLTQHVLDEASLTWADIDGVIPVGGSTRMPMVSAWIQEFSGKPPLGGAHPDEAVALGAAVQASIEMERISHERLGGRAPGATAPGGQPAGSAFVGALKQRTVSDVIAHSLGMIAESADRERYINSILIKKNLAIPSQEMRPYQLRTRRDGQNSLEVFLTQGETENPQECAYLGRYIFTDFPPVSDRITIVEISYTYDRNGVVDISAVERTTRQRLKLTVESVPSDVPERFMGKPSAQGAREHMTFYLAFDLSGSMTGQPLDEAKRAAETFVSQCDLSATSVGLIEFSDSVRVTQGATQNNNAISRAIRHLSIGTTGYGNDGQPFDDIYSRLQKASGSRYAIVLTDGMWSHQDHAIKRAQRCHQAGIEIIAIGFGGADRAFLQRIASSSEQGFFTDLSRLTETFSAIAQELTESASATGVGARLRSMR